MNAPNLSKWLALTAGAAVFWLPDLAFSQEANPNVTVVQRARPDFDPRGIRAGGFLIFPSVTVDTSYDDNIFATDDDETDDVIVTTRPNITAQSNFSRHALRLSLDSAVGRYVDETDENFWDYGTNFNGRLDITRRNRLIASGAFGRGHEARDDVEDQAGPRPTRYFDYEAGLRFEQDFNRFNFAVSGNFARRNFRDTKFQDQDDRDRNVYGGALQTGYFISPRINAFLQGTFTAEERDQNRDDQGRERGNKGYGLFAGTDIDITGLLFGDVRVGYRHQTYDDGGFDDEQGFAYGIGMTWNPTGLTSVRVDGAGDFVPTDQDEASSNFQNRIAVNVDHELLRNLLIGASAGYTRDDFQGEDRTDNRFDTGAGITYLVNRYFTVGGNYLFSKRTSDNNDDEFTRNIFTFRVNARL